MLVKSQVKYIQSLSQKKQRDADDVFVAEGPKIINELLDSPNIQLQQLFATDEWIRQNPTMAANAVPVTNAELARLSFLQTPNQVTAIFRKPVFPSTIIFTNKISLMMDEIQDPGNMGTIIRSADWFGTNLIICSRECADVFNPKVVQATMGSISRVQVIYNDLLTLLQKKSGVPVYAATLDGRDLNTIKAVKEAIILIGNESRGIDESLLALCDHKITIPQKGKAESLNAAVATGIILNKFT
jgi:TrmH family RNA methyltransferase